MYFNVNILLFISNVKNIFEFTCYCICMCGKKLFLDPYIHFLSLSLSILVSPLAKLSLSFILIYSESDSTPAEVSILTRKDNPFLTPEKESGSEQENEEGTVREKVGWVVMPDVKTDDLARRRAQSGSVPQRDPLQSLAQTTITQSDLEKWQRLKMNTDSRCLTCDFYV